MPAPHPQPHPLPAIQVPADTAISDCVRRMRDLDVGSVLVLSDDGSGELVGIFTERDLIMNIELVERGSHWKKPVRTIMTRNVRCIDISEIDKAPTLMLKYGFRHLPVVVMEKGRRRLAGVLSMRDLFQMFVQRAERDAAATAAKELLIPADTPVSLAVVEEDSHLSKILFKALPGLPRVAVRSVAPGELKSKPLPGDWGSLRAVLVDLDAFGAQEAMVFVRKLGKAQKLPSTFLLYDPLLFEDRDREALIELRKANNSLRLIPKPIVLTSLFREIATSLGA